jgi:hypothetical protein
MRGYSASARAVMLFLHFIAVKWSNGIVRQDAGAAVDEREEKQKHSPPSGGLSGECREV